GLALADPDPDAMLRPPRDASEPIIPAEDMQRMGIDSATIAAAALTSHFVGLARYGAGPETRGMTFLSLTLGQLLYTLVCQRRDPRKLRPDALLENRTLDAALLASSGLAVLPFFVPPLRRLLGIAPIGPFDAAIGVGTAFLPFASVLARRGIALASEEIDLFPELTAQPPVARRTPQPELAPCAPSS
ncbi:MAG: cation-translocating P-type ATPase C-terminal domain-containing protein, partial [Pseudomonadota bacterium]